LSTPFQRKMTEHANRMVDNMEAHGDLLKEDTTRHAAAMDDDMQHALEHNTPSKRNIAKDEWVFVASTPFGDAFHNRRTGKYRVGPFEVTPKAARRLKR
jgi:hypothetical protein